MPNSRRRKFSIKPDITSQSSAVGQNGQQTSDSATNSQSLLQQKPKANCKHRSKPALICPIPTPPKSVPPRTSEAGSSISIDKVVTADSSNIDLCNLLNSNSEESLNTSNLQQTIKDTIQKEILVPNRNKHLRQHRATVRSPKRRISIPEVQKPEDIADEPVPDQIKKTRATSPVDRNQEAQETQIFTVTLVSNDSENDRQSNQSIGDMCRICHGSEGSNSEFGALISACSCRGTVGRVHVQCLERWLTESGKSRCELCGTVYATKRVHRYGIPRGLVMWLLSQNAKQLMVDVLGIMLMSPLAVMAAWLSGKTLAGLMTQDLHITPWPLASTFVLACMTLVCYYCWIVSAATRHALAWWIWYRAQYEVRLQLGDYE